MKNRTKNG